MRHHGIRPFSAVSGTSDCSFRQERIGNDSLNLLRYGYAVGHRFLRCKVKGERGGRYVSNKHMASDKCRYLLAAVICSSWALHSLVHGWPMAKFLACFTLLHTRLKLQCSCPDESREGEHLETERRDSMRVFLALPSTRCGRAEVCNGQVQVVHCWSNISKFLSFH